MPNSQVFNNILHISNACHEYMAVHLYSPFNFFTIYKNIVTVKKANLEMHFFALYFFLKY